MRPKPCREKPVPNGEPARKLLNQGTDREKPCLGRKSARKLRRLQMVMAPGPREMLGAQGTGRETPYLKREPEGNGSGQVPCRPRKMQGHGLQEKTTDRSNGLNRGPDNRWNRSW